MTTEREGATYLPGGDADGFVSSWVPLNEYWAARVEQEAFRIFPRQADGTTRPITIYRQFLYMKHEKTGLQTTLKRFLHKSTWHWHVDGKWTDEIDVRNLLTAMMQGRRDRAETLMLKTVLGQRPEA